MKLLTFTKQSLAVAMILGLAGNSLFAQTDFRRLPKIKGKSTAQTTAALNLKTLPNKHKTTLVKGKTGNLDKAAGDTLFFQDFEGATWPADMPRVNADGKTPGSSFLVTLMGNNAWVAGTLSSDPDGRYAISASWTTQGGAVSDWMITPPITLTENNKISWISKAYEEAYPDGYEVRLCTNCPATFTAANVLTSFTTTLFSVVADQTEAFLPHEVSLSSYAGQTVQLAFRNNSNDQNLLMVDDILVSRQASLDVMAGEILSPSNGVYDCSRANFPAAAVVVNKGAATAYNVIAKLKSTGPIADSSVAIIDSIEAGVSDTITFGEGLDLSTVGDYQLLLDVTLTGDENMNNNMSMSTYEHIGPANAPFFSNFDNLSVDTILPEGWFCTSDFLPFSEDGGFNGSQSITLPVYNNNPTFGTKAVCSLITGKFKNIPAGSVMSLKYKVAGSGGAEYALAEGDTLFLNIYKNCQPLGASLTLTSANFEPSPEFTKIFVPLDLLALTATDEVTFEFMVKAAPASSLFFVDIDDFKISTENSNNDVAVVDLERFPLSQVKRYQLGTLKFKGNVFNEGQVAISPVRITALVDPTALTDTARINVLPGGSARTFTTAQGITFTESGSMNISLSATTPGVTDPNPDNNGEIITLDVTDSTMAKDFGEPLADAFLQYGAGSGGNRIMANALTLTKKDTLTSVSVYVGPLAEDCEVKAYAATKNQTTGAWVQDSSQTLVPITVDMSESWVPLVFRKTNAPRGKAYAAGSEILFGVKIRGGNLRVGFNLENAEDDGSFIFFSGALTGTQGISLGEYNGPFSLFIRSNFGRPSTITSLSQLEQSLQYANLIPNPATDGTSLQLNLARESKVALNIYSTTGHLINTSEQQAFRGTNRLEVPIRGLSKGIYLVQVKAEGYFATKKLVIE